MSEINEFNHASNIKKQLDDLIGAKTVIKKRKKSQDEYKREIFYSILTNLEKIEARNMLLETEIGVEFGNYNEAYENTIQDLLTFTFGVEICKLVYFYIYERFNEDGSKNELYDGERLVPLDNPTDLYNLVLELEQKPKKYH